MSTVTLPPIGAKIRVITVYPDGTTFSLEGVVAGHNIGRYTVPVAELGEKRLAAYLEDNDGANVAVEVLEMPPPPEPPDLAVVEVRTSSVVNVYQRDDRSAGGMADPDCRWFGAGHEKPVSWSTIAGFGDSITPLVPDPAALGPEMPWFIKDNHGDTLTFRTNEARDRLMVGVNDGGNDYVNLFPNDAAAVGRALLRWAGERA